MILILHSTSDIFIGVGKYGETVFTFLNYITNTKEGNIRIDFQIRLFPSDISNSNNTYSDDNYKNGSIHFSYNIGENINTQNGDVKNSYELMSPLVGISDGSGYNQSTFSELYFSDLKTNNDWVENQGVGLPFLRTFLTIVINNTDTNSINNLKVKYPKLDLDDNKNESGSEYKYKLILDDLNSDGSINDSVYETSFIEDNYYVKIFNLGDVRMSKFSMAIRSIYDYEEKKNLSVTRYSDLTNFFYNQSSEIQNIDNTTLESEWLQIPDDKFIDITNIFSNSFSSDKDFHGVYFNTTNDTNNYNSKIFSIQVRYDKKLNSNFVLENNLLVKVTYKLKSDTNSNQNTSLSSAVSLLYNGTQGGNNQGPYNYQEDSVDYYFIDKPSFNSDILVNIVVYDYLFTPSDQQLIDFTEDEALRDEEINVRSNLNNNLKLELIDENGLVVAESPAGINHNNLKINFQKIKPFNIIEQTLKLNKDYYIKISGSYKLGYYGISLIQPEIDLGTAEVISLLNQSKFSKINTQNFPLSLNDSSNRNISNLERLYTSGFRDNLVLLMSDSSSNKMKIFNYSLTGALKTNYPLTTNYDNDEDIVDLIILNDNKILVVTNPNDVKIDLYNGNTLISKTFSANITLNNFFSREIIIEGTSLIYFFYLNDSNNSLKIFSTDLTLNSVTEVIESNPYGSSVMDEIIDVAVFDENNIFVIGNLNNEGVILKLTLSGNSSYTNVTRLPLGGSNRILFGGKFEFGQTQRIVILSRILHIF